MCCAACIKLAERATIAYGEARCAVARYLGVADADEIVFTSGTTGALNLVARSFGEMLQAGDEIVISEIEHHSNLIPWQMLRDRRGIVLRVLPVTEEGRLDLSALERVVTPKCRLIAVTHVSNVTGAVTEVPAIVAAAKAVGAKVLLDGAQRARTGRSTCPASASISMRCRATRCSGRPGSARCGRDARSWRRCRRCSAVAR